MRKISLISMATIFLTLVIIISCQKDEDQIVFKNITIKTAPSKIDYYEGEILNLSGLKITITMSDGKTEDIDYMSFTSMGITCSPENGTELTQDHSKIIITHTESENSVSQSINVIDEVINISIKTEPTEVNYYWGDNLDLAGLIVTLTKYNEEKEDVAFLDFNTKGIICSPENETILSSETIVVKITHEASGKKVNYVVPYITIVDEDDNHYHIVNIGEQTWMAENLKTTKYNDGTEIPLVTDGTEWSNLTTPAYCLYDNYNDSYGALYNWFTVNTGKLCPDGWHVPSDEEWTEIITYVGGESIAGSKLKEVGTGDWIVTTDEVTNEFYFSALPGGDRSNTGDFVFKGTYAFWWSFTENGSSAFQYSMKANENQAVRSAWDKKYGYSVRCIQD